MRLELQTCEQRREPAADAARRALGNINLPGLAGSSVSRLSCHHKSYTEGQQFSNLRDASCESRRPASVSTCNTV